MDLNVLGAVRPRVGYRDAGCMAETGRGRPTAKKGSGGEAKSKTNLRMSSQRTHYCRPTHRSIQRREA